MSTLVLGSNTEIGGEQALVVRLVHSQSIFELADGSVEFIDEQFAELRRADGTPEFISLTKTNQPFIEKKSNIRALDPIWRPK